MKSQATLVATHKDEKPNILQEPTNQPILSQQTPSYTLKSSKVPSSIEASLKDDGSDTNDDTAAKKSKGRKIKEVGENLAIGTLAGLGHLLQAIT